MDDDPTDELARVVMTLGSGSARAVEILNRNAQDRKQHQAQGLEAETEQQLRRWDAQAAIAERTIGGYDTTFVRTSEAQRVAAAWEASRTWASVDPERFGGHYDRISRDVAAECGIGLDAIRGGEHNAVPMTAAGVTTKIEQGRLVAQGVDPEAAAARVAANKQTPYRAEENEPTRTLTPTSPAVRSEAVRSRDAGRGR